MRGPPLRQLRDHFAKKGLLGEHAPVMSINSVTIDAPVAPVWRLIIDMRLP
jgi:hypothetical protein